MNQKTRILLAVAGFALLVVAVVSIFELTGEPRNDDASTVRGSRIAVNLRSTGKIRPSEDRTLSNADGIKFATSVSDGFFEPTRVDPDNPRPEFPLLDENFVLTSQAIDFANLDADEIKEIQGFVDTMKTELTTAAAAAVEIDSIRSDSENGVYAFRIAPYVNAGKSIRYEFLGKISKLLSTDDAKRLSQTFNWHDFFGACGEVETLVTFREVQSSNGAMVLRAEWEQRNPETGKRIRSTSATYEDFVRTYGEIVTVEVIE